MVLNALDYDMYCTKVTNIGSLENIAYVEMLDRELNHTLYQSADGGYTWRRIDQAPLTITTNFSLPPSQPLSKICDPTNAHICYRATSESEIEETVDGGQSWHRVSLPFHLATSSTNCRVNLDVPSLPPDLAVVKLGSMVNLIVGNGMEGVIVRLADETWLFRSINDMRGLK